MNGDIVGLIENRIGQDKVVNGEAVQERYDHIWNMDKPLRAKAVVLPKSTHDVSETLKICHQYSQPIVVHGGLTNLVGGTETNQNEIVISMERMNRIEDFDEQNRTMIVQSGVILENIQNAAKDRNLLFPLNFGAKGSAQIGGAISTNAGGLRVFRFGMTRNLVLGLETVLPDGTIISSMKKIIKDNSAYDLKHLFIGSEGTLGVITKAVLKLVEAPKSRVSAFIGLNEYDKVVQLLRFMDAGMAGTLSGYELMLNYTFVAMTSPPSSVKAPMSYEYKYYILLEGLGSDFEKDQARLAELLESALSNELILDAVIAQSEADLQWFWTIREDAFVMVSQCNNDQQFDISLPTPQIGKYIDEILEKLKNVPELEKIFAFGHVADGNIHFIVGKSEQSQELINRINDIIYTPLKSLGGSVSAEHGIGLHKKSYLPLSRSKEEIQLMKTLKNALDPKNILNRGKVLD